MVREDFHNQEDREGRQGRQGRSSRRVCLFSSRVVLVEVGMRIVIGGEAVMS